MPKISPGSGKSEDTATPLIPGKRRDILDIIGEYPQILYPLSQVSKIIFKQGYDTISLPKNYLSACPKIAISASSLRVERSNLAFSDEIATKPMGSRNVL